MFAGVCGRVGLSYVRKEGKVSVTFLPHFYLSQASNTHLYDLKLCYCRLRIKLSNKPF